MAEDKNYANGVWVRERKFQNGGSALKVSGKVDDFCAWLKSIADERGDFRMAITAKRAVTASGVSHTVWQDKYEPANRNPDAQPTGRRAESTDKPTETSDDGNLPF